MRFFAFHDAERITNGRIQATNNRRGVLTRVANGFVNSDNFAAKELEPGQRGIVASDDSTRLNTHRPGCGCCHASPPRLPGGT